MDIPKCLSGWKKKRKKELNWVSGKGGLESNHCDPCVSVKAFKMSAVEI